MNNSVSNKQAEQTNHRNISRILARVYIEIISWQKPEQSESKSSREISDEAGNCVSRDIGNDETTLESITDLTNDFNYLEVKP